MMIKQEVEVQDEAREDLFAFAHFFIQKVFETFN